MADVAKELRATIDHDAGLRLNTVGHADLRTLLDALDDAHKRIAESGWQSIESAPKDGSTFLAVNAGSIERWHTYKEGCVVTRRADARAFTCCRMPDGGFMDEFGDEYLPDGRIHDAEDLTAEDEVLRLTMWQPLPAPPSRIDKEDRNG
ncbi:hypothetical protein [Hoeflea sp. 108]|uniref:hypothetical protein n=1 Tax=Hoeflea sp. 108 TaxID=1116369 RepID=UPI00035F5C80|nr:hypothetical protein [Hoeflea sp. 108]